MKKIHITIPTHSIEQSIADYSDQLRLPSLRGGF